MSDPSAIPGLMKEITLNVVGEVGPRGPAGPPGPMGPPGTISGSYRFAQPAATSQWVVTHNLQYPPAVTVVDSAGTQIYGDVTYIDDVTIHVDFGYPIAGYAYLS